MNRFADFMYGTFKKLQEDYGFRAAREFAGRSFVPFVGILEKDVFLYVFIHDGRAGSADIVVTLWVAPPHPPDDGLDKLKVGLEVVISHDFDVDDSFFYDSQDRVIRLLPYIKGLAEFVRSELKSTALHTDRYRSYRLERKVYETICDRELQMQLPSVGQLFNVARSVVNGAAPIGDLETACIVAARELLRETHLAHDVISFYDGDADFLGSSIVGHVYVHTLLSEGT